MTEEEYQTLLLHQDYRCSICGVQYLKERLAVDHDHQTNVRRGLLCRHCNTGLGWFRDNLNVLKAAVCYLEIHNHV